MIQFLRLRRSRKRTALTPMITRRTKVRGDLVDEKVLQKVRPVVICGLAGSGKSKWIRKIADRADEIFICSDAIISINARFPLSSWISPEFEAWIGDRKCKSLHEKLELLPDFIQEKKAAILIEDADLLTGRKMQLATAIVGVACRRKKANLILSCTSEKKLPPAMRGDILRKKPQYVELSTKSSYDATQAVIVVFSIFIALLGWYELAIVIGALGVLSRGRFAIREK